MTMDWLEIAFYATIGAAAMTSIVAAILMVRWRER
jgi:hypothetical protein